MKENIKAILFILIFLILLNFFSKIFIPKGNGYGSDVTSFYQLERNSLDIIFFGSSHSYATFSPDIIEEKTGMKSYNFATQQQPIYITYYYMVEALKTQKPKYFVLETMMLSIDEDYTTEGVIRDALDKMKMSKNKIEAINVSVEKKDQRKTYYFNIMKYHSRYEDIEKDEVMTAIRNESIQNRGFIGLPVNSEVSINNIEMLKIEEKEKLLRKNQLYLNKIIDLARENNIELVFVKAPNQLSEKEAKKYNTIKEIANEEKIDFINYNEKFEELNLVNGEDFYDYGHLSYKGAEKVSNSFAKYIIEKEKIYN